MVAHVLPNTVDFIHVLASMASIAGIIPKPASVHLATLDALRIMEVTREQLSDPFRTAQLLAPVDKPFIILDIGGYFAPYVASLGPALEPRLLGVVEDTENGLRKYESIAKLQRPVFEVARSPLKRAENFHVAKAIVSAAESIMNSAMMSFDRHQTAVIGYGNIGSSIAHELRARLLPVSVYDKSDIVRLDANSRGFATPPRDEIIRSSSIIFCATGNHSLRLEDFRLLRNGCVLVTATSSDDEWLAQELPNYY